MNHPITPLPQPDRPVSSDPFESLVKDALKRLRSPRSRRVYRGTYNQWRAWCEAHDHDPHGLTVEHVEAFLIEKPRAQATVNRMLAALRTLLAAAVLRYPEEPLFERLDARLKLLRVHVDDTSIKEETGNHRRKQALRGDAVYRALDAWNEDRTLHRRNRALLATLFYTGMRRAEAAALRWEDVDLEGGVIHIAHGKGDKERTVPILGEIAIEALQKLRADLPDSEWVFPQIRRGDHPQNEPLSGNAVWSVVKATGERSGIEFSPHDARRTVITGIIENGGTVRDAQAVAGHAAASTTMVYAQAADAKTLREKLKVGY